MSNITTRSLFKAYSGITGTAQDALIDALIPQVQGQVERYLRRSLELTTYKVWLDGSGSPVQRLFQYPITALYQVYIGARSVANVSNNSASVTFASVSFDGTNFNLVEVATNGTETITQLSTATYKTIATLQAAIATHAGWSCTLLSSDYTNLPAMLRPIYGQPALDPATGDLIVPDQAVSCKIVNEDMIEIIDNEQFPNWDIFPQTERLPNRMSSLQPGITPPTFSYGFPPGTSNIFCWFQAGYTFPTDSTAGTLPTGLSLVFNEILHDVLSSININGNLSSEHIGDYSYNLRVTANGAVASAIESRKRELNQYRRVSI